MVSRILILAALACSSACAQTAVVSAGDDSLYRALGGKQEIKALTTAFVGRLKTDPRIGGFFKDTKASYLAGQLADQFCQVAGGPCVLDSPGMKKTHEDMAIHKADFDILVEILQQTMDDRGIAFTTQNRLLAKLAPMHRDIISR